MPELPEGMLHCLGETPLLDPSRCVLVAWCTQLLVEELCPLAVALVDELLRKRFSDVQVAGRLLDKGSGLGLVFICKDWLLLLLLLRYRRLHGRVGDLAVLQLT